MTRTFGLPSATIRFLSREGLINPAASSSRRYTFQDLIVLRTVAALKAARIPSRSIYRALRQLKPWLTDSLSLSRVSWDTSAVPIRVRDGRSLWEPNSGQYALGLESGDFEATIANIHENSMKKKADSSHAHYLRGAALEQDDTRTARAAYEACLAGNCRHLEARINLGRLLHLEGLLDEAERIYRGTEEPSSILYFNLGILLEDLQRDMEATAAYRDAIAHDPFMADAHFNLSLLHERLGEAQAAFRHLLAYRRLTQLSDGTAG